MNELICREDIKEHEKREAEDYQEISEIEKNTGGDYIRCRKDEYNNTNRTRRKITNYKKNYVLQLKMI